MQSQELNWGQWLSALYCVSGLFRIYSRRAVFLFSSAFEHFFGTSRDKTQSLICTLYILTHLVFLLWRISFTGSLCSQSLQNSAEQVRCYIKVMLLQENMPEGCPGIISPKVCKLTTAFQNFTCITELIFITSRKSYLWHFVCVKQIFPYTLLCQLYQNVEATGQSNSTEGRIFVLQTGKPGSIPGIPCSPLGTSKNINPWTMLSVVPPPKFRSHPLKRHFSFCMPIKKEKKQLLSIVKCTMISETWKWGGGVGLGQ